jgi:hypothetical protein
LREERDEVVEVFIVYAWFSAELGNNVVKEWLVRFAKKVKE